MPCCLTFKIINTVFVSLFLQIEDCPIRLLQRCQILRYRPEHTTPHNTALQTKRILSFVLIDFYFLTCRLRATPHAPSQMSSVLHRDMCHNFSLAAFKNGDHFIKTGACCLQASQGCTNCIYFP